MSDFHSDLKDISFVKSPANAVVDLYDQYVHDLVDVLDRHAPLVSRLTKKESTATILLDRSAAFDTIGHSALHTWTRVGGSVLNWFISYLSKHYHSIKMVLLFLIFVNCYLVCPKVLSWVLYCFHCTPPPPSVLLLIKTKE